jgi:NAD(P)-dependent dehydrogenase (short-subunit alcohol dehydrogenase family)
MGRELARRAVARGDRVVATVYSAEEAEGLGTYPNLHVLQMDVGSTESVAAGFDAADAILAGAALDIVINCAGISPSGAIEVEPISMLEHTFNINATGTARVIQQALPRLRGHGGRILVVASLWGKVGGPMLGAYCASKHAIEAITDSVRRETHGQDVRIVLIEPGVVRTSMLDLSVSGSRAGVQALPERHKQLYGELYENFAKMIERESTGGVSVEKAADVIERAAFAKNPATRYTIGKDAKAVIGLSRLLPDRALDAMFRKILARN